jgi:hypothetical protein
MLGRYFQGEDTIARNIPSVVGGGKAVPLLDDEVRVVVAEPPSWDPRLEEWVAPLEPLGSLRSRNIRTYVQGMNLSGLKGI